MFSVLHTLTLRLLKTFSCKESVILKSIKQLYLLYNGSLASVNFTGAVLTHAEFQKSTEIFA